MVCGNDVINTSSFTDHNNPTPPCYVPWIGKTFESQCFKTLYTNGSISIRQYDTQKNEVFVNSLVAGSVTVYQEAINLGAYEIFTYFTGANNENKNIEKARTVPLILRKPSVSTNHTWIISMMVATSQYPNITSIPKPTIYNTTLGLFGEQLFAVYYVHSDSSPQPSDFDNICGSLIHNVPSGFTILAPNEQYHTYYNTRDSVGPYDYECWVEVQKKA